MSSVSDDKGHRVQYYGRLRATGSPALTRRCSVSLLVATLCLAATSTLTGCGERSFTAEEFVDEANANGVALTLGEPLSTEQGGTQLYSVTISEPTGGDPPSGNTEIGESHGGGSLRVEDDSEAAEAEYTRCEQSLLFCFRAANVVLIVEDAEPETLARLTAALRAIEDE